MYQKSQRLTTVTRVTRWVCKKVAQNVAQPMPCQNWYLHNLHCGKNGQKLCYFCNLKKPYKENNQPIGKNLFKLGSMLCLQFSSIFDNFRRKSAVFLKIQCYDNFFLQKLAEIRANFAKTFGISLRKYFLNHNIGPRSPWSIGSSISCLISVIAASPPGLDQQSQDFYSMQ
jgi:hypothetical protein